MEEHSIDYDDFYLDENLFDEMLIDASKQTFSKIRIPGKYTYSKKLIE